MFLTSFTISVLRGCDWTAAESDGNKQNWNHIAVKKKTKNNNRGSIDSFTEICLLHQSCSDPGEVSEGITGSHAWRSSPARHVSSPTLIVTSTSSPSTNAPSHRETHKHTVHHLSRQQSDMMGNETQRTQTNPGFVVIARKKNHTCLCVNVFRYIHF